MNLEIFQAFKTPIYTNIYKFNRESARTMDTPE